MSQPRVPLWLNGALESVPVGSVLSFGDLALSPSASEASENEMALDLTKPPPKAALVTVCFWVHGIGFCVRESTLRAYRDGDHYLAALGLRWFASPKASSGGAKTSGAKRKRLRFAEGERSEDPSEHTIMRHVELKDTAYPLNTATYMPVAFRMMEGLELPSFVDGALADLLLFLGIPAPSPSVKTVALFPTHVYTKYRYVHRGKRLIAQQQQVDSRWTVPLAPRRTICNGEPYEVYLRMAKTPLFVAMVRHVQLKTPLRFSDAAGTPGLARYESGEHYAAQVRNPLHLRLMLRLAHVKAQVHGVAHGTAIRARLRPRFVQMRVLQFVRNLAASLASPSAEGGASEASEVTEAQRRQLSLLHNPRRRLPMAKAWEFLDSVFAGSSEYTSARQWLSRWTSDLVRFRLVEVPRYHGILARWLDEAPSVPTLGAEWREGVEHVVVEAGSGARPARGWRRAAMRFVEV